MMEGSETGSGNPVGDTSTKSENEEQAGFEEKDEDFAQDALQKLEQNRNKIYALQESIKQNRKKRMEHFKDDPESSSSDPILIPALPTSQKLLEICQQMQQNKKILEEKDRKQKLVTEMVNSMNQELKESREAFQKTSVGISMARSVIYTEASSKNELLFGIKTKNEEIAELTAKIQELEKKEKSKTFDKTNEEFKNNTVTLIDSVNEQINETLQSFNEVREKMRLKQEDFTLKEKDFEEKISSLKLNLTNSETKILELNESKSLLEIRVLNLSSDLADKENKLQEVYKITDELSQKIQELKKQKENIDNQHKKVIEELQSKIKSFENNEQVKKLNKQLDDMNKNMIKLKAQHKAKLKELQKNQNVKDLNDKIKSLESENLKLSQKVAELEEDKGNMQLRIVELEFNKDKEIIADLEHKIEEQTVELENHIRTITSLESQLTKSSEEISSLRSEVSNFMHIENAQVCSEMTSVQLEEQLDKEISKKKEIENKFEDLVKENQSLVDKIENLNKEKQELSTQLDNYMQENIELIDRLEKLSAEKVSSAESIEIVDALTQQEKLEIEAYQKNLDFIDKTCDDVEHNVELNESVSKLNEETCELMQRIELFTAERREVMEKMENISLENQQLLSKIQKLESEKLNLEEQLIETNQKLPTREAETEEKLNEQLSECRALIANQEIQISSLQEELWNKPDDLDLRDQLKDLQEEISQLQSQLALSNEKLIRKSDLENNVESKNKEIESLKQELNELHQNLTKLTSELGEKENIHSETVNSLSSQLSELKSIITENISQLEQYESEINKNSKTIEELNDKIEELTYKITETEHILEMRNMELIELKSEKYNLEANLVNVKEELKQKDDNFAKMNQQLKEQCEALEKQIKLNVSSINDIKGPLETRNQQLEKKNTDLIEKLKKIAANLKKKSVVCQELESQVSDLNKKLQNEIKVKEESQKVITDSESKVNSLVLQLEEMNAELNNKNNLIKNLQESVEELKQTFQQKMQQKNQEILDLTQQLKADVEENNNQLVEDLMNQLKSVENVVKAKNVKLQEKDLVIENLESENFQCKERTLKVEEELSHYINKCQSLKVEITDLKTVLQEKLLICENISKNENSLQEQLDMYFNEKKQLQKKIEEIENENKELNNQIRISTEEVSQNSIKVKESLKNILELQEYYETIVSELKETNSHLESEIRKLKIENDNQIATKNQEMQNLEYELNSKINEIDLDLKNIIKKAEISENRLEELTNIEKKLTDEVNELTQINLNLKQEIEEREINLEYVDDLKCEINRLREIIDQKEKDIENYQMQNIQLQMARFDNSQVDELTNQLKDKESHCQKLANELDQIKTLQLNDAQIIKLKEEELLHLQMLYEQQQIKLTDLEKSYELSQEDSRKLQIVQQNLFELEKLYDVSQNNLKEMQSKLEDIRQLYGKSQSESEKLQNIHEQLLEVENLYKKSQVDLENLQNVQKKLIELEKQYEISQDEVKKLQNVQEKLLEVEKLYEKSQNELEMLQNVQEKLVEMQILYENSQIEINQLKENIKALNQRPKVIEEQIKAQKVTKMDTSPDASQSEYSKEELIKKIKALELLLFNIEKEKDDTIVQCHDFTNELMRLVYEREKMKKNTVDESVQESIESQIIPIDAAKIFPEDKKEFDLFQFTNVKIPQPPQSDPVEDEIKSPKHFYVCEPSKDVIAGADDDWGWNAGEAQLEMEHQLAVTAPVEDSKVQQLEEKIHDLEVDRSKLLEEIKTSQIRSGKLLKKFKVLKEKYDNMVSEKSRQVPDDLDAAIQEELNSQNKSLETRIKELQEENSKEKSEKETLLKRIDVLTAANNQLIEMKEKQDNEIHFLQFKNRETSAKLEQLEWGDSPVHTKTSSLSATANESELSMEDLERNNESLIREIDELKITIRDLSLDNEEMQCMLEEQRNMRLEAEKALSVRPSSENAVSAEELLQMNEKIASLNKNRKLLENKVSNYATINEELNQKLELMNNRNQQLQNEIIHLKTENESNLTNKEKIQILESEISVLKNQNYNLENLISEKQKELQNLEDKFQNAQNLQNVFKTTDEQLHLIASENFQLKTQISVLEESVNNKQIEVLQLSQQLQEAMDALNLKNQDINYLQQSLDQMKINEQENQQMKLLITNLDESVNAKRIEVYELSQKLQEVQVKLDSKAQEVVSLQKSLDQIKIGNTEENNQLRAQINYLESEISLLSQKLNEATSELEFKNPQIRKITEENNQLKFQVDKLEKDINDKQIEISELLEKLHKTTNELNLKNQEINNLQQQSLDELKTKESECSEVKTKLNEFIAFSQQLEEDVNELKVVIDQKSAEIENLKAQLQENEEEYKTLREKTFTVVEQIKTVPDSAGDANREIIPTDPMKAELDLTMYMFHQQDVRCKELMQEVRCLLAERDTLQLKLSSAIRTNEELRLKLISQTQEVNKAPTPVSSSPDVSVTDSVASSQSFLSVPERTEELDKKLSELKSLGYRNVSSNEDKEMQQLEQLVLMQQHRDLTSRLPPEAAAQLVDASYSVSRDVQSPAKSILNWLWGRNPPKVDNV